VDAIEDWNRDKPMERRWRAIFISDTHLGTPGCKAPLLLDFLKHNDSEWLYLVGDIVDGWSLQRSWYWHQSHNDVVQKLVRKARKGTHVIYVPGNHDESLRQFAGHEFGRISLVEEAIHRTADGRRFLVVHGDLFDGVVRYAPWLARIGDWAYQKVLWLNGKLNAARCRLGYPYWSLSAYLKYKVKNAVEYVSRFEETLADEARRRKVDGVVCGHIHKAEIRDIGGIVYCNDGDWVESCTALAEDFDGSLHVLEWAKSGVHQRVFEGG
jgi:UDP-2,3-diacylglucosamine pyrophosphatase LpxH